MLAQYSCQDTEVMTPKGPKLGPYLTSIFTFTLVSDMLYLDNALIPYGHQQSLKVRKSTDHHSNTISYPNFLINQTIIL